MGGGHRCYNLASVILSILDLISYVLHLKYFTFPLKMNERGGGGVHWSTILLGG